MMDLQKIFQKRAAQYTGLALARVIPKAAGYRLAKAVSNRIVDAQPRIYRQTVKNLSFIPTANSNPGKLEEVARQNFAHMSRFYFEFYHLVGRPLKALNRYVEIPPEFFRMIADIRQTGQGVQLAGMHLGNFDLVMLVLAANGLKIQTLSAADPNEGYQVQNKLRASYGLEITPITPASLRTAITRLKDGEIVAVGLDWPHPEETDLTDVFGHPAYLPLGTARLALLSDAATIILATYADSGGIHRLLYSEPIEVIRTGNKRDDIIQNTRAYIRVFEDFVSRYPEQWIMHHPFWAIENNDPLEKRIEEN